MTKKRLIILIGAILILLTGAAITAGYLGLVRLPAKKQDINLFPAYVLNEGKKVWGLVDRNGKMAVNPAYDSIEDYNEYGFAKFTKGGKYGILDKNGREVLKAEYDNITDIDPSTGYTIAKKGNDNTVFDAGMRPVHYGTTELIKGFKNNVSAFTKSENRVQTVTDIGYMDKDFNTIIPLQYKNAEDFINGRALVTDTDGKNELIDIKGKTITKFDYEVTYNGNDILGYKDAAKGKVGFIKFTGEKITDAIYYSMYGFDNDRCIVSTDQYKFGLVDTSGKFIIPADYHEIKYIGNNLYIAWPNTPGVEDTYPTELRNGAVFNSNGDKLTDFLYRDVGISPDGAIWVAEANKTYFIDNNGRKVSDMPEYAGQYKIKVLKNGEIFRVMSNDRMFYTNKKGDIFWDSNSEVKLSDQASISSRFIYEDTISVVYPYVTMKDASKEFALNDKLKQIFTGDLGSKRDVKKSFARNYSYTMTGSVLNLTINESSVEYANTKNASASSRIIHININNSREYILADLFIKDSDYIKILADLSQKAFDENNNTKNMPKLLKPVVHPDTKFSIDKDSVSIYFNPSEVYEKPTSTSGEPKFPIYFSDINSLIDKQGEFWKALGF